MPLPLADLFQALADPTRLRVLALLRELELSVGELAQLLGQSQPRVSRHVKILVDAGVLERRKEGSWVFLTLARPEVAEALFALIEGAADEATAAAFATDRTRLAAVRRDRAEAAERYFAANAHVWDEIRSLHVAESEVEGAIVRALGSQPLGRLVDIGTGTGRMIELFGRDAAQAIGIDKSSEMLRFARAKLAAAAVPASLRQGDMYALPLPDGSADVVLLHQVLHYAQAPGQAIAEAARLLGSDGRLLIVDFAPHEREELRERAEHARLGFADEAILGWFAEAGLTGQVVEQLAGGELTVTLWAGRKAPVRQPRRRAA
ncbi:MULTISPECIES: ArsR/SmtB family transcription factor [Sphingomonas]|uniref:ArsR/SmtB family transcription factor n=1 Tax=Sphingomonas TaxID=13687 RepID=UPI000DEF2F09|nr:MULTISPECIES: metalloregulator ArsR/SmtB family transcription factor [Sphingomonas]